MQKSAGYGRTTRHAGRRRSACCAPEDAEKERFRTHEATVIPQWDGILARCAAALHRSASRSAARGAAVISPPGPCSIRSPACAPSSRTRKTSCFSAAKKRPTSCCGACAPTASSLVVGTSGCGKSSLVRSGLIPSLHSGLMVRGRLELARGDDAARRRSHRPPCRGARRARCDRRRGEGWRPPAACCSKRRCAAARSAWSMRSARRTSPPHDNVLDRRRSVRGAVPLPAQPRSRERAAMRRSAFVKLLLEAATSGRSSPIYVVLTMRSDFIGDCMEYPGPARGDQRRATTSSRA